MQRTRWKLLLKRAFIRLRPFRAWLRPYRKRGYSFYSHYMNRPLPDRQRASCFYADWLFVLQKRIYRRLSLCYCRFAITNNRRLPSVRNKSSFLSGNFWVCCCCWTRQKRGNNFLFLGCMNIRNTSEPYFAECPMSPACCSCMWNASASCWRKHRAFL